MKLTTKQRQQLIEAIDSHIYWQLSDAGFRNDGAVIDPGSHDPETVAEIEEFEKLRAEIAAEDQHAARNG